MKIRPLQTLMRLVEGNFNREGCERREMRKEGEIGREKAQKAQNIKREETELFGLELS
jgi:hypothetical protein